MRVEPALLLYRVPRPSLFVCLLFHFVVRVRARVIFFCGRIMHRSNYYDGPPGRNLCAVGVGYRSTSWTLPLANNSNVTKDIMDPSGAKPKRTTTRRRKIKKKKKTNGTEGNHRLPPVLFPLEVGIPKNRNTNTEIPRYSTERSHN